MAVTAKLQTLPSCGVFSCDRKNILQSGPELCVYHPDRNLQTCRHDSPPVFSAVLATALVCRRVLCPVACCLSDLGDAFRTPALVLGGGKHHHSTPKHFSGENTITARQNTSAALDASLSQLVNSFLFSFRGTHVQAPFFCCYCYDLCCFQILCCFKINALVQACM